MSPTTPINNTSARLIIESTQLLLLHQLHIRETSSRRVQASPPDSKEKSISSPVLGLFGSSNDPFDDSMDLVLMRIQVPRSHHSSVNSSSNQPDALDTDVDVNVDVNVDENCQGIIVTPVNSVADRSHQDLTKEENASLAMGEVQSELSLSFNGGSQGRVDVQNSENGHCHDHLNSDDESNSNDQPVVGERHEFGDYGGYFANKRAKQQLADAEYVKWERKRHNGVLPDPIFQGCLIHVNGHTEPSIDEIHRLILLRGGKFIAYLTNKGAATHIICDHLTPRKRIQFKNYKVVKAQWIVDSIAQNILLDWTAYRLIEEVQYGQKRLEFAPKTVELMNNDNENIKDSKENGTDDDNGNGYDKKIENNNDDSYDNDNDNENDDDNETDQENGNIPLTQSQKDEEAEGNNSQSAQLHMAEMNAEVGGRTLDATHPDFLKHFFAYSRLHHLSKWKADLRAMFVKKILNEGKPDLPKSNNRVILHIDFDCFFATASSLKHPGIDITRDAVAVSHGQRTSDVASCNYVARAKGVRNGMWMGQARKLCPELKVLDYEFNLYEDISNAFYDYFINLKIFDAIFPVLIDEVLIDASSFCTDLVLVKDLCTKIRQEILLLTKCSVSIGASRNVLLAKLATRKAKPDGQFYLDETQNDILLDTPFKSLPGIGRSLFEKFESLFGVKVPIVRDILPLSKEKLQAAFGPKTGEKLYNYARGVDDTSINIHDDVELYKRKTVSVDVNYGIRFQTIQHVDNFLIELSKELYRRLIELGLCGSTMTLKLARRAPGAPVDPPKFMGTGKCVYSSKTSKLGIPTNDWGILGSELKAMYRFINIPITELRGIAISMTNLEDVNEVKKQRQMQLPFAANSKPESPRVFKEISSPLRSTSNSIHTDIGQIDTDVFQSLPLSIRNEIEAEMKLRGVSIPLTLKSSTPRSSPTKRRKFNTSRSPTKSPQPRIKSKSPTKSDLVANDYHIESFDESVFDELPPSIQKEVLQFVRNKNHSLRSILLLLPLLHFPVVDKNFIRKSDEQNNIPRFQGRLVHLPELKRMLSGWIKSSVLQAGPHMDDVLSILDYIERMLQIDEYLRCLAIIEYIKVRVQCEKAIYKAKGEANSLYDEAFEEWTRIVNTHLVFSVERYCIQNKVDIDFSNYLL